MSRRKSKVRFQQPARHQHVLNEHPTPEYMPDFSLSKQVAIARREMGEARWAQLDREWDEIPA